MSKRKTKERKESNKNHITESRKINARKKNHELQSSISFPSKRKSKQKNDKTKQ